MHRKRLTLSQKIVRLRTRLTDREWRRSEGHVVQGTESNSLRRLARCNAEQNSNVAGSLVGYGQIQNAISIEIPDNNIEIPGKK